MEREAVNIHDRERPHQTLEYKTPDAVHRAFRALRLGLIGVNLFQS